jgi:hypothetical protein
LPISASYFGYFRQNMASHKPMAPTKSCTGHD